METLTKREYIDREDYSLRIAAKIPRTASEIAWERANPGYELHAAKSWAEIAIGSKIWRGYEGEEPSLLIAYTEEEDYRFTVTEYDEAKRGQGIPAGNRIHSTRWSLNIRFARVIVKI